jgi:hypothetical protein
LKGFTYDDAALERLQQSYKMADYDALLMYVKRYGMHRHFEVKASAPERSA